MHVDGVRFLPVVVMHVDGVRFLSVVVRPDMMVTLRRRRGLLLFVAMLRLVMVLTDVRFTVVVSVDQVVVRFTPHVRACTRSPKRRHIWNAKNLPTLQTMDFWATQRHALFLTSVCCTPPFFPLFVHTHTRSRTYVASVCTPRAPLHRSTKARLFGRPLRTHLLVQLFEKAFFLLCRPVPHSSGCEWSPLSWATPSLVRRFLPFESKFASGSIVDDLVDVDDRVVGRHRRERWWAVVGSGRGRGRGRGRGGW